MSNELDDDEPISRQIKWIDILSSQSPVRNKTNLNELNSKASDDNFDAIKSKLYKFFPKSLS